MQGGEDFDHDLHAYDYELPEELIAQVPAGSRESSRLLLLDRNTGRMDHRRFREVGNFFKPGDLLVVNDTRVVPARLHGWKETGGRVEILVLEPHKGDDRGQIEGFECLVKSSKPVRAGAVLHFQDGLRAVVLEARQEGRFMVQFPREEPLLRILETHGEVPLPPYIRRGDEHGGDEDRLRYQTVYAQRPGAVAAPTAGLHFTPSILEELLSRGVETAAVTLHVGYGTFSPVRSRDVRRHTMHSEHVEISGESGARIRAAKRDGRRIVAVGTTVVRVLEWVALQAGEITTYSGQCNHYIYPGYVFKAVNAMITNFHLPMSSLILLVSAFAGRENILRAYGEAVARRYRFFSYGDAMLIA